MSCRQGWFMAKPPGHARSWKFAGTFTALIIVLFVGHPPMMRGMAPCWYPLIQGFPHTHTKPLGHDFANQKNGPQCGVLFPTVLCCDMEHGAQMSVTLCCLLQQKPREVSRRSAQVPRKRPITANHCIRVSGCSASNHRPTNKAGNRKVLFRSVLGCDMERGAESMGRGCHQWGVVFCLLQHQTKGSFTAFSAIPNEEGWQKQTAASEFPAVQQATNDRQTRLVTARCCFAQCWVATWNVVLKCLCTWAVSVTNEVWCFACSNIKPKEVSRRSVQVSLKKADKSKPLHQKFWLFSKQPTTDKKGW